MKSREEIRDALTCPIASVPTLFLRDGSIDFDGVRNFVDFAIAGGTKTMLITFLIFISLVEAISLLRTKDFFVFQIFYFLNILSLLSSLVTTRLCYE